MGDIWFQVFSWFFLLPVVSSSLKKVADTNWSNDQRKVTQNKDMQECESYVDLQHSLVSALVFDTP